MSKDRLKPTKFKFQVGLHRFEIDDLDKEMNKQFQSLYEYYFQGLTFDLDVFKKSTFSFFDQNSVVYLHDNYFNNFTIIWEVLIQNGAFLYAEQVWQIALEAVKEWELTRKERIGRIHKGAAYYFWGVTCILKEDLEKGFFLMHQALMEDEYNRTNESKNTPAYAFVKLDFTQHNQYFRNKVLEISSFLNERLKYFQLSRNGTLTLQQLKTKFMDNTDVIEYAFLFVYELFHIKKIFSETKQGLTQNVYGSMIIMQVIFTFALLIDNIITQKYDISDRHKQEFIYKLAYLSQKSGLSLDLNKLRKINDMVNSDFKSVLLDLLDSKSMVFKKGRLTQIEEDLAILYALRNSGAHKIDDRPFIYENFEKISQRVFNAFFLSIEKLY
jgi:hypothetical protein